MRSLSMAILVWSVMGVAAAAATPDKPTAPIGQFIDSFNKGDMKSAAAAYAATDLAIIDEVPPHLWRGPGAFQAWSADLISDAQKRGFTEPKVTIANPTRQDVNGDRAYVVVPAVYTYKDHGVAMREPAQMTFALQQEAGGWRISGWAWSGMTPQPVAAPTKP